MTSNLAIAAVSAVMKYVLQNPLAGDSIAAVVPDLVISAVPPHRVPDDDPHLNVFFYRALVNPGWAQNNLPSRSEGGGRVSNPYLALDLYYLISAHATVDYQGEVLLGYAMQAFHENPVLGRSIIRTALTSPSLVTTDTPLSILTAFAAADLAEQFEQIRITPYYPSTDELSNVWSPMNTGYVPTAYYKVSVVLIESKRPATSAPPVRGYNVYALPFKQPVVQDVIPASGAGGPIFGASPVLVRGSALRGDVTRVVVGGVELTVNPPDLTNEQIALTLPAGLSAGIIGVQVMHLLNIGTPPTLHRGIESNVAAFILQPMLTGAAPGYDITMLPATVSDPRRLQIGLNPTVGPTQRGLVLLNELNPPSSRAPFSYIIEANTRPSGSPPASALTFPIPDVQPAAYLVRVRVDGAESPLDFTEADGYVSPAVTL